MAAARNTYFAGIRPRSIAGIWYRHALVLRHTLLPSLTWYFVEPFVILVAVGIGIGTLVVDIDGVPYAQFVTPGIIAGSAMFHAIFECCWGAFFRIQKGVYETTLTAPVSTREIAMGDISWAMSRAVIVAVSIGTVAAFLGWIDTFSGVGVLLAAALVGAQFGALGLIFAALAPNVHILSLTFTVVATPLYFFSGAFFPISSMPDWIEPLRLGRAANALCAPGAGICNRGPGDVPPALRPLCNGLDRRALPHRRCPLAPPSGQVNAATESQQRFPNLFEPLRHGGRRFVTRLGSSDSDGSVGMGSAA